jgi:hypothetical protein
MIKNEYDDSVALYLDISTKDPSLRLLSEDVWNTLYPDVDKYDGKRATKEFTFLKIVIFNLHKVWSGKLAEYIGYSRNKADYINSSRYNKDFVSYAAMKTVMEKLIAHEFVKQKDGVRFDAFKRCSRIKPSERLITMFGDIDRTDFTQRLTGELPRIESEYESVDQVIEDDMGEVIVLKAPNETFWKPNKKGKMCKVRISGQKLEYEDDEETRRMRKVVEDYNLLLRSTDISLHPDAEKEPEHKPVDLDRKKTERIFNNGGWEYGGRLYGCWWQQTKKVLRKYITIDGQSTTEIDYGSHHIVILYSYNAIDYYADYNCYGDPYSLAGYEGRDDVREFCKVVLLACLNSKSANGAASAIRMKVSHGELELPEGVDIATAISEFEQKHQAISEYLYSGVGMRLQLADSEIAESVIRELTSQGIPVLGIHDSFICKDEHVKVVSRIMEQKLQEYMLDFEVTPKLKYTHR